MYQYTWYVYISHAEKAVVEEHGLHFDGCAKEPCFYWISIDRVPFARILSGICMIVPWCAMSKFCVPKQQKSISKHGQTCSYPSPISGSWTWQSTTHVVFCCLFEQLVFPYRIENFRDWTCRFLTWNKVGLAGQLSPVFFFHSYWTFSARQTYSARPYRMGRRLHPFRSIEC